MEIYGNASGAVEDKQWVLKVFEYVVSAIGAVFMFLITSAHKKYENQAKDVQFLKESHARLSTDVGYMKTDLTEIKQDIKELLKRRH